MHLEITTKFKTSQMPLELIPKQPKFFAPTPAIGRKARESVPRDATITGYECEGLHFRVYYVHNSKAYRALIKIPANNR